MGLFGVTTSKPGQYSSMRALLTETQIEVMELNAELEKLKSEVEFLKTAVQDHLDKSDDFRKELLSINSRGYDQH